MLQKFAQGTSESFTHHPANDRKGAIAAYDIELAWRLLCADLGISGSSFQCLYWRNFLDMEGILNLQILQRPSSISSSME